MQAVGSVLAIFAAIAILVFQRMHTQDDRRTEAHQFIFLALGLSQQAVELSRDTQVGLERNNIQIDPSNFTDVIETMDRLPFEKMPTAEFVLAYVNIRRSVKFCREAYVAAIASTKSGEYLTTTPQANTALFNLSNSIRLQHERLADEAKRLGVQLVAAQNSSLYDAIRANNAVRDD